MPLESNSGIFHNLLNILKTTDLVHLFKVGEFYGMKAISQLKMYVCVHTHAYICLYVYLHFPALLTVVTCEK